MFQISRFESNQIGRSNQFFSIDFVEISFNSRDRMEFFGIIHSKKRDKFDLERNIIYQLFWLAQKNNCKIEQNKSSIKIFALEFVFFSI